MAMDQEFKKELTDVMKEVTDVGRVIKKNSFWLITAFVIGSGLGFALGAIIF